LALACDIGTTQARCHELLVTWRLKAYAQAQLADDLVGKGIRTVGSLSH
jgi:hypothetical protein